MKAVTEQARALGATGEIRLTERAIIVEGLDEQRQYLLQHTHRYQVHDKDKPHHYRRHGRADIGWPATGQARTEDLDGLPDLAAGVPRR